MPNVFLRSSIALFAAVLLIAAPCLSFQAPLSDESIREAYFLGQRNDQTMLAAFTAYIRGFDRPQSGPAVAEVELYTPFIQLVELSRIRNAGYSAQQATQDYRRGTDMLFVRVRIDFTPTYGTAQYLANTFQGSGRPAAAQRRADFAQDFRITLVQGDRSLEPLNTECHLTNTPGGGHFPFDPDGLGAWQHSGNYGAGSSHLATGSSHSATGRSFITGWLVWLQFDAKDVSASDDAVIDILGPDNLHLTAKYDLSKLR